MHRPRLLAAVALASCLLWGAGCASQSVSQEQLKNAPVYRVSAGLLNLVKCPNLDCDIIEDVHGGQEVAVISPQIGDWVMVHVLATGHEGYLHAKFLQR